MDTREWIVSILTTIIGIGVLILGLFSIYYMFLYLVGGSRDVYKSSKTIKIPSWKSIMIWFEGIGEFIGGIIGRAASVFLTLLVIYGVIKLIKYMRYL